MHWQLRPAPPVHDAADLGLRRALFDAGRSDEMAATGWPLSVQEAFLAQQFSVREAAYAGAYPGAADQRIWASRQPGLAPVPVGRVLGLWQTRAWHLIDIALLPAWQRFGIGRGVMQHLLVQAARAHASVALQVVRHNTGALALYASLGFVDDPTQAPHQDDLYRALRWQAVQPEVAQAA